MRPRGNFSWPSQFFTSYEQDVFLLQPSAVITRSSIVRYHINDYRNWDRISIRCWIHKIQLIPRPYGWAMECHLWIFFRKLTIIMALHCMSWLWNMFLLLMWDYSLPLSPCEIQTSNVKDLKSGCQCPQKHCLPEGRVPGTFIINLDLQKCCRGTYSCMFLHNFAALGLEKIMLDCQPFTCWIREKWNMNVYNIIHHLNKEQIYLFSD